MPAKILSLLCLLIFSAFYLKAQVTISKNVDLKMWVPAQTQDRLLNAVDTLLVHINQNRIDMHELRPFKPELSKDIFSSLKGIENNETTKDPHYYKPQLINLYPVAVNEYIISVAFIGSNNEGGSLRAIFNFTANVTAGNITFSIPAYYISESWKSTQTGNIIYHYADHINIERAKIFNQKNTQIAVKLGLKPEKLDFYLCDNYQQVLKLFGYEYDSQSAGIVNEGYGVDEGTLFSIMHNEDFSHDLFHYYAAKVRTNGRNSAAEEGIAYSWGNAYYANDNGEMITPKQMLPALNNYLQQHPQISLFELFSKNPLIFGNQTKVRSLLSSFICDELERRKGVTAIKELINCGTGDDNYFKVVNKFIGINPANFNVRVKELINQL